jgi:hypothetical protein
MTKFIGLSGKKGVGKDALCSALRLCLEGRMYSTIRVALADRLREVSHQFFGRYGIKPSSFYIQDRVEREEPILALANRSPRDVWKEIGNNMRAIHPDVWVDQILEDSYYQSFDFVIIPDVRFHNEVARIHDVDGLVFRVVRPDLPKPSPDPFDDALDEYTGWDGKFINLGPIQSNPDLYSIVDALV